MPMFDDKKKIASLIIRRISPNREVMGEKRTEEGAESDNTIAMESAAEEIMQAIERKDSKQLVSVLRSFIDMTREMDEEESNEDEQGLS